MNEGRYEELFGLLNWNIIKLSHIEKNRNNDHNKFFFEFSMKLLIWI